MKSQILELVKGKVKNWWVSLIVGVIAIALGVCCLLTPGVTLATLTYVFIFAFFISGIFEIFFSISNRKIINGWGWFLASGIIEFLLGVMLLLLPLSFITAMLAYLVGFWIMFRSIWMIGESVELQQMGVKGWGWLLSIGIICLIFSFIFLISPMMFKGTFIVAFASVALFIYGIFRVILSFKLRSLYKGIKDFEHEIENI